jgi:hypothetical protein
MKRVAILMFALTVLASASVEGAQKYGKRDRAWRPRDANVAVHVRFLPREVRVIRDYYSPRHRGLPPGLRKKLHRTGHLPAGWQRRFQPFPVALERQLIVLPHGYRRGVIDGHAVVIDPRTQVVVDLAVLF